MSTNQLTNTEKEQLAQKLKWADESLAAILSGEKPAIDPVRDDQKWLLDQLNNLYKGQYTPTPGLSYVTLPGDTDAEKAAKGITNYHPIAARFVLTQKRKLVDELHNASIHNFHVMGSDDQVAADADHYVLVPSGIQALHQTVQQMRRNLAGDAKLVIVQNNDDVWTPLQSFLKLDDKAYAAALVSVVTAGRPETKNTILYTGKDIDKDISKPARAANFPHGIELLFGSTQPKKADETSQILRHEKSKAGVRDAVVPLHWFLSADEVSKTFEGNSFEKIDSMLTRIYDQIGYDTVAKRLQERGFDPERIIFCANDTGVSLSEDLSAEPEFAASLHERIPNRPWPGVELGPVVDAQGGIMKFMADVKACRERLGHTEPLRYLDTQVYMFFKLAPKREDVKIESYFGTGTGFVTMNPRPTTGGSLYTENYCIPDGQPDGIEGKTQAELGTRYLYTDSPQARCLRAMTQDLAVPTSLKPLFKVAAERNRRSKLDLRTQDNFIEDIGDRSGGAGFSRQVNDNGWSLSRKKFSGFEDFAESGNAIYLGAHSKEILADYDKHHARLSLLFCKAGTHKQILHDTMYGKELMICNPEMNFFSANGAAHQNWADPAMGEKFIQYLKDLDLAEHPWGQQLLLYRYFHENSLIKQQPKYIWNQVDEQSMPAKLREAREKFNPHAITRYTKEEYGQDREDMFSVTVLGSAGTRNPIYTESAYYLGYESACHGIHVRSGGGRYGIMGWTQQGVLDFRKDNPALADTTHLSAIQMPRTVQFEGLALDLNDLHAGGNSYVSIEPGMDPRMQSLFRSDVMVMDAGGLGTLEEIYYFLDLKHQGHELVKDKPLILINHAHLGQDAIRLYDPLLAVLPEADKKDIFVVPDAKAAMALVLQFKADGYKPENERKIVNSRGMALSLA